MLQKNTPKALIKPEEAAALSKLFGTLDDVYRAKDIFDAYLSLCTGEEDHTYMMMCALAAVYSAGRIQGIREERNK